MDGKKTVKDGELLGPDKRIQSGGRARLERFIHDYADQGFQFAFRLCGSAEEASELVQESFYRVLRHWESYDPAQSLENWFLTILRNVYYDGIKRFERRNGVSTSAPVVTEEGETGLSVGEILVAEEEDMIRRLEREEEAAELEKAMSRLSPEHRAVLSLCDMQGLSYDQMAVVLDCPVGTVRSRLSRAREALREILLRS